MTSPPPRSRGVIALVEANCTVCMLCARECPDWCIYIEGHQEELADQRGAAGGRPAGRPAARNVLDRFDIDFSLCMYCGICVDVCPFDALLWSPHYDYPGGDIRELLHGRQRLAGWVAGVPAPEPLDVGAAPPREAGDAGLAGNARGRHGVASVDDPRRGP